jgi:putative membrane protein
MNSTDVSGRGAADLARVTAPAHFAWLQARLALERTLLAWVRTAAAMIGFGFAIFHFFEAFNALPGVRAPWRPGAARLLGVALVAIGTFALLLALIQYMFTLRFLNGPAFRDIEGVEGVPHFHPGLIVAWAVTAVGLVTLWTVLARLPAALH